MIALEPGPGLLARFVADLERQAPRALPRRPDLSTWPTADVAAARLAWAARIVDEYRSVVVFADLLRLLGAAEAPFSALCTVQRLIGDELRHTRLCAEVVGWLGGFDDLQIDLQDLGLPPLGDDETPAGRALLIVARELVVAETESVHILCAYRDATTEPAVRAVLGILLRDEARHAAAGKALAALLRRTLPAADLAGVVARLPVILAADRAALRATYRAAAVGGPGRGLGAAIDRVDLRLP